MHSPADDRRQDHDQAFTTHVHPRRGPNPGMWSSPGGRSGRNHGSADRDVSTDPAGDGRDATGGASFPPAHRDAGAARRRAAASLPAPPLRPAAPGTSRCPALSAPAPSRRERAALLPSGRPGPDAPDLPRRRRPSPDLQTGRPVAAHPRRRHAGGLGHHTGRGGPASARAGAQPSPALRTCRYPATRSPHRPAGRRHCPTAGCGGRRGRHGSSASGRGCRSGRHRAGPSG